MEFSLENVNERRMKKKIQEGLNFCLNKYPKEDAEEFLKFINKMQDDRETIYVSTRRTTADLKAPNHKMILYLKKMNFDTEIHNFLNYIFKEKIEDSFNIKDSNLEDFKQIILTILKNELFGKFPKVEEIIVRRVMSELYDNMTIKILIEKEKPIIDICINYSIMLEYEIKKRLNLELSEKIKNALNLGKKEIEAFIEKHRELDKHLKFSFKNVENTINNNINIIGKIEIETKEPIKKICRGLIRENFYPDFPSYLMEITYDFRTSYLTKIRTEDILNVKKDHLVAVNYSWKINMLKNIMKENFNLLHAYEKYKIKLPFLENLYHTRNYMDYYMDIITQLITYDVLHEKNSIEYRENSYKKLDEKLDVILDRMKSKVPKQSTKIYNDFFTYIYLNFDVLRAFNHIQLKKRLEKEDEINSKIRSEKLSKEEILKYYLENEKSDGFFSTNYIDVEEIFDISKEKEDFSILWGELEKKSKFKNMKEKTQKNLAKLLFDKGKSHNNYDRDLNVLKEILNLIPVLGGNNLQALKVLAEEIYSSKIKTSTRKTLMHELREYYDTRLENKNLQMSEELALMIREKITRGMYREKEILEEYSHFNILYEKLNMIQQNIVKLIDLNEILIEFETLGIEMLDILSELNKDKEITVQDPRYIY